MTTRTNDILNGVLTAPAQIMDMLPLAYRPVCKKMFQSLWNNYLKNKGSISLPYWSDRVNNPKVFNLFLTHLSKAGWITTSVEPKRNWAEARLDEYKLLKWVSLSQLNDVRATVKFHKYKLTDTSAYISDMTKTSSGIKHTGLTRNGFTKAGNNKFQFDTDMLYKYQIEIGLNVTKSMRLLKLDKDIFNDGADYMSVSEDIIKYYLYNDGIYTLGDTISDSRGRAISQSLSKVFNPLGFKDARALLVTESKPLGISGLTNVYLFIAELLGLKPDSINDKRQLGYDAYIARKFHDLDLTTDEGRKDLHENIWLERIYNNLDTYPTTRQWNVPIELDFTASMLQIEGLLLNHTPFLDRTNVIGDILKDIWTVVGIPRKQFKKAMTPILYGSSQPALTLWKKAKIKDITAEQIRIFNKEISTGDFAVANAFKDFIITNVKPQPTMTVKIWNETFTIECNRFRNVGDYTKRYDVYDSKSDSVKSIYHTHTHKEPDLQQFRRYFVTLLIHNLDSQAADKICTLADFWVLPNHDAFIVHPADANSVKSYASDIYNDIYANRNTILKDYFDSVGIDSNAAKDWSDLQSKIKANMPVCIKNTLLK